MPRVNRKVSKSIKKRTKRKNLKRKTKTRRNKSHGGDSDLSSELVRRLQPATEDIFIRNIPKNTTAKTNCTKINTNSLWASLLLQIAKPERRQTKSHIINECQRKGNSGSFNVTCLTELNGSTCNEMGEEVLVRMSKDKITSADEIKELKQSVNNILFMAETNIGPKIYDIQYTTEQHIIYVMEKFQMDLDAYIKQIHSNVMDTNTYNKISDTLAFQTNKILKIMASRDLVCIDIKPLNVVLNVENELPDIRFIDVDADWCSKKDKLTVGINSLLKIMGYTQQDRLDLIYKIMLVLFANHLQELSFNYMHQIVESNVKEHDTKIIIEAINQSLELQMIFKHYFKSDLSPGKIGQIVQNAKSP
jgi:hypothetical protein